jgi:hypothetical protein
MGGGWLLVAITTTSSGRTRRPRKAWPAHCASPGSSCSRPSERSSSAWCSAARVVNPAATAPRWRTAPRGPWWSAAGRSHSRPGTGRTRSRRTCRQDSRPATPSTRPATSAPGSSPGWPAGARSPYRASTTISGYRSWGRSSAACWARSSTTSSSATCSATAASQKLPGLRPRAAPSRRSQRPPERQHPRQRRLTQNPQQLPPGSAPRHVIAKTLADDHFRSATRFGNPGADTAEAKATILTPTSLEQADPYAHHPQHRSVHQQRHHLAHRIQRSVGDHRHPGQAGP